MQEKWSPTQIKELNNFKTWDQHGIDMMQPPMAQQPANMANGNAAGWNDAMPLMVQQLQMMANGNAAGWNNSANDDGATASQYAER